MRVRLLIVTVDRCVTVSRLTLISLQDGIPRESRNLDALLPPLVMVEAKVRAILVVRQIGKKDCDLNKIESMENR